MTTTNRTEIRFTAKSALYWNNRSHHWIRMGVDKAREMIALGQAVELKAGEWI